MKKKPRAKSPKRSKKSARPRRARPGRPMRIIDELAPERTGAGRPSKYVAEYAHIAETMLKSGATLYEVAIALGVNEFTLRRWKAQNPEFCAAVKDGKERSKQRVEEALFHRAVGYTHETQKIITVGTEVVAVRHAEHYPPDTGAICFYLKNADPIAYKDRHEVSASVHTKRSEIDLTDEELLDGIAREEAAKKAAAAKA